MLKRLTLGLLLAITGSYSYSQSLPVGSQVLEDALRRLQISGEKPADISYTIRPVAAYTAGDTDSIYNVLQWAGDNGLKTINYAHGKGSIVFLPATIRQQFNSHHPYGWNDGSMIQAKGYQTQISAGIYTKIGPLSIQLRPEFVYAQNADFEQFPGWQNDTLWRDYYYILNRIDNPEKFGNGSYTKFFPGNPACGSTTGNFHSEFQQKISGGVLAVATLC